ncbi:hypothetical protein ACFY8C_14630 [Streptomyces flavochromogenes]|uniref:Uncharacterized protein n=1 Tax=Streptomyces flavochromogenes TaxID=68199 RepID=A0ABW6XPZ8_9ACTN
MTSKWPIPRPTEAAAIRAADHRPRGIPPIQVVLADLLAANELGDRRGVNLCAHKAARVALGKVGEQ